MQVASAQKLLPLADPMAPGVVESLGEQTTAAGSSVLVGSSFGQAAEAPRGVSSSTGSSIIGHDTESAPKVLADIVESIIGATFLDSGGDLGKTAEVCALCGVRSLGI